MFLLSFLFGSFYFVWTASATAVSHSWKVVLKSNHIIDWRAVEGCIGDSPLSRLLRLFFLDVWMIMLLQVT